VIKVELGRRDVLLGLGASLVLAGSAPAQGAVQGGTAAARLAEGQSSLTAWIRIEPDNRVVIIASQAELGQGISTTLPAIVADELGADWANVVIQAAPFDRSFRNPRINWMFTGNSESVQAFYLLMRTVGASAREMLIATAAERWQVPTDQCQTEASRAIHGPTKRAFSFGELAADAARLPVPQAPKLKAKQDLKLVGKSLARVDVPGKVDGTAIFGLDVMLPGILSAAIRTAPTIGGTVKSIDEAAILARPGLRAVVRLQNGFAIVADRYHQARGALQAHPPLFDPGPNTGLNSATVDAAYRDILENGPWVTPVNEGRSAEILQRETASISADYHSPFAAHATMEPMNCTAHVTADKCEIWAPTQGQEAAHVTLRHLLGLKDEQITINRTAAIGGGFGRRLLPDFVVQAALVSRAVGRPVKIIWDREEDMLHDMYRPATASRFAASLGSDGLPVALQVKHASPTILLPVFPPAQKIIDEKGIDPSALEGLLHTRYALPNRRVDFHLLKTAIPTSVMRGTGYGPTIFALEGFVDELAQAAKVDPYEYRRRLLAQDKRALAVLDRAASMAEWRKAPAKGRGRGIVFADAFGTLISQVIEVEVTTDAVKLLKISTAVDCGEVLDPGIAAAGIEGGIVFGLAYCKSEVTFRQGRVNETNLDSYELPYLAETPPMRTQFITSGEKLGGVGEVSPVTVPPALANAIFAATGRRLRSMPLARHGLRFA
jgi:isoquinoline 1-oxidoreductase subunit beta